MVFTSYFDICAVLMMALLIFAHYTRKLTKGRTNHLFVLLCTIIMAVGIIDFLDDIMMVNAYQAGDLFAFRLIINYAYFLLRNLTIPIFILYICSLLGVYYVFAEPRSLRLRLVIIPYVVDVILVIANVFTNCIFYIDENSIYHRGPLLWILYATALFYMCMALYLIVRYRNLINRAKWMVLTILVPIVIISVGVQVIIPTLKIEVFATAMLALIVAVAVQRPEELWDYVMDCHSLNAFISEMDNVYKAARPTSVLLIHMVNDRNIRNSVGIDQYTGLLHKIADKLTKISLLMNLNGDVYYLDHWTFAVAVSQRRYDDLVDMGRLVSAYMREPVNIGKMEVAIDAKICIVNIPKQITDKDSFLNFTESFYERIPDDDRIMVLEDLMASYEFRVRNEMDAIIARAISNNGFRMYYQPIFSIEKNKFVSAEALIRLEDEQFGFVSPALFIPASEESGAIHTIGDFVLDDVCRFIASDAFRESGLEYVEINLSVAQCIEPRLAEKIFGYMKKHGVRNDQINLEITETSVDYDPSTTDRNIRLLSNAGISFSLDDYGTGYSNIKRVVSLPLEIVKLDKTLVDEMHNPQMWIVIKNTVSMLKKMKKKILVEGVEDAKSFQSFADLGCDYIQGYYFARPMPENEFLEFVRSNNKKKDAID